MGDGGEGERVAVLTKGEGGRCSRGEGIAGSGKEKGGKGAEGGGGEGRRGAGKGIALNRQQAADHPRLKRPLES